MKCTITYFNYLTILFQCDFPGCSSAFKQPYDYVKHKMSIHSDERKFSCEECGNTFKLKGNFLYLNLGRTNSIQDLRSLIQKKKLGWKSIFHEINMLHNNMKHNMNLNLKNKTLKLIF